MDSTRSQAFIAQWHRIFAEHDPSLILPLIDDDIEFFSPAIFAPKRGKTVVFYCSVGERSSRMATHVRDVAREAGAKEIYNLSGGIFAWHNDRLPLVSAPGRPTEFVHPFDATWGRLVDRQSLTRTRVEPGP